MYGIAGVWGRADQSSVKRMMNLLTHRGPDSEGTFVAQSNSGMLGHCRLSITDPEGGGQPICTEDLLPPEIVWRNKEQFDEGSSTADLLAEMLKETMTEAEALIYRHRHPNTFLRSTEECLYDRLFLEVFDNPTPALSNVGRWSEHPPWPT